MNAGSTLMKKATSSIVNYNYRGHGDIINGYFIYQIGKAAGPSGLQVQHLLDVASVPLPTTICSLLRRVVNLRVSEKVPQEVSRFMAGGSLTTISKLKPGCAPDKRPIAVALEPWKARCLDISVVSPLNPSTLAEARAMVVAVLEATKSRKHQAYDEKCLATPLAVDSYGA
ncbi:hypothetical protein EMCRGX_G013586 [Ephydatia muelleri]